MDILSTLLLTVSLSSGFIPNYSRLVVDDQVSQKRFFIDTRLELSAMDGGFFLANEQRTEALKAGEGYTFIPISDTFTVSAGIRSNGFEFGWAHYCQHPVQSYIESGYMSDTMFSAADTVYVRWEGKFRF